MDISSEFTDTWEAVSYAELDSMTNDDAITYLKSIDSKYIHGGDSAFDSRRHVAIAKAIVALRDQKPKEDTKCSDYIIETDGDLDSYFIRVTATSVEEALIKFMEVTGTRDKLFDIAFSACETLLYKVRMAEHFSEKTIRSIHAIGSTIYEANEMT